MPEQSIVLVTHCPAGNTYPECSLHVNGLGLEPAEVTCFGSKPAQMESRPCAAVRLHPVLLSLALLAPPVFRLLTLTPAPSPLHSVHPAITPLQSIVELRRLPCNFCKTTLSGTLAPVVSCDVVVWHVGAVPRRVFFVLFSRRARRLSSIVATVCPRVSVVIRIQNHKSTA